MADEEEISFMPEGNILQCVAGEISKLYITNDEGVSSFVLLQLDIIHPERGDIMRAQFGLVPEDAWALGDALQAVAVLVGYTPQEGT